MAAFFGSIEGLTYSRRLSVREREPSGQRALTWYHVGPSTLLWQRDSCIKLQSYNCAGFAKSVL